jgi:hypothetical protein
MVNGEMHPVENQSHEQLQKQLKFSNGGNINPSGSYQNRDMIQSRLHDGECLNMEGEMFKNTYQRRKMIFEKIEWEIRQ